MADLYCTTTPTGKGFIRKHENKVVKSQKPGNIYVVDDSILGKVWITRVNGILKTKVEAQGVIDGAIASQQATYDALSDEDKAINVAPAAITLD
tara:strand:+ start:1489 stop:1770 length:282 start_codon:yes stop_codon:yes gene_type:complete